jgi:small subunit ribosomal protein S18
MHNSPFPNSLPFLILHMSKSEIIDYKNVVFLRRFVTEQGKILSRRLTGVSAKDQRKISKAIKHARLLGLLQFVHRK